MALASAAKSGTPELRTLLARAQTSLCAANRERLLFDLFAAEYDKTLPPPVAAVTHAHDTGSAGAGWWLRADPVALRPDGDRLLMLGQHALSIRADEAAALGAELREMFAARGFEFSTPHPQRWYLRLAQDPGVTLTALDDVVGHDIMQHLPQAQDTRAAARWRSLLNEVQMQLHGSPVNHARVARGELPINSVWFWGGGASPRVPSQSFVQVWSHEPLSLGLARLGATTSAAVPASGAEWLQRATLAGSHLLVLGPPAATDAERCAADFNATWCAPLLSALKSGTLEALDLYTDDGKLFHNTRRTLRPWFCRWI